MTRAALLSLAVCLAVTGVSAAQAGKQTREEKVLNDRKKYAGDALWIYNDLAKGFTEARKTGKPMLIVMRCIPCEECVKLDDDLVNEDKRVRPLLEQFVCVRVVSTNGLDLSLFQFDYDQSFAAFLLNADGTVYGRFGTRSHRTYWSDDVSIEGLAKALQGALDLHRDYPKNKDMLAARRGPAPEVPSPEQFPLLKDRYKATLDVAGKIVPSCIHCHQVGEAQKAFHREKQGTLPEYLLFSYPHPKTLGLILDPKERATVLRAEKGSLAEKAGFQKGDTITRLAGQPLLSIADVQWVLHRTPPEGGALQATVQRGDQQVSLTLTLPKGWRQAEDISWRVSSWGLRRVAAGGMLLETLPAEERKKAGVAETGMALRVKFLGSGAGPHGAAQRAGFRQGDILVSFDGRTDLPRETELLAHALTNRRPDEVVAVTVVRGGKQLNLKLPIQK
jgi:hypothetical protein